MNSFFTQKYVLRVIIVFLANFFAGLGVALLRISCLGTDPFSALAFNFSELLHLPLGIFTFGIHFFLMIFMLSGMKKYIGIGMVINMVLFGIAADFWQQVVLNTFPLRNDYAGAEQLPLRLFIMVLGLFGVVFFLAFYMASDTGMSPYDGFAYELAERFPLFPYKVYRMLQDGCFLIMAFIVGIIKGNPWTSIGTTTIIMVFFIGPVVSFFRNRFADPLFQKIRNL